MKRTMLISLIAMIAMAGCVSPVYVTSRQMDRAEGWVKSEIVWSRTEVGRNPWADGQKIYIDLTYIEEKKLPLRAILQHEDYHNQGLVEHCPDPKCLMYYGYQMDLIFGAGKKTLCNECRKKLRPTTLEWLEQMKIN